MTPPRQSLFAATRNPAKLAALAELVGPDRTVVPLPGPVVVDEPEPGDLPGHEDPIVAIASAKAVSAAAGLPGRLVIASDGGLLVPALGPVWQPARTRRGAGPGATDDDRVTHLLGLAEGLRGDDRRIAWREAVAVAVEGRVLFAAAAESPPGRLADAPAAGTGSAFWVPRVWLRPDGSPADESDHAGHWSRLRQLVRPFLEGLDPSP